MKITNKIIENHGLKLDEYKNIQKLLKRDPNILEFIYFLQCGMNIAHINHQITSKKIAH